MRTEVDKVTTPVIDKVTTTIKERGNLKMSEEDNKQIFKWLLITLAVAVNLLTLISWIDAAFYHWPSTTSGWVPLLASSAIGVVLIKISLLDWKWQN
ncbi:MAG: hypothetical protein DSZ16_09990 [Candidatus Thioglobus sp.]|nr:MAG: hypothetical protein DSZ16_09990 [Candidatus Thioglobus sp.]RUM80185.1 MAG: hypothetical protein DSZ15_01395 [Candidatus Thioglobus sp.]